MTERTVPKEFNDANIAAARRFKAERDELAREIERLRKALMPFAYYCNFCDERRDDDALEVPIKDLRRARTALTSTECKTTENIEGGA